MHWGNFHTFSKWENYYHAHPIEEPSKINFTHSNFLKIQQQAESYFRPYKINMHLIRTRPRKNPYNFPDNVIIENEINFQMPNIQPFDPSTSISKHRTFFSLLKNKQYAEIIDNHLVIDHHDDSHSISLKYNTSSHTNQQLLFHLLLGYISSVALKNSTKQLNFIREIEKSKILPGNIPHFNHLIDEIRSIHQTQESGPLLKLFSIPQDFLDVFIHCSQPVPHFSTKSISTPYKSPLSILEQIKSTVIIPPLEPDIPSSLSLCPGHLSSYQPSSKKIADLITDESYEEAISKATLLLEKSPENANLFLQRAIALTKLNRFHEAIADCSESLLHMKKNSAAFVIRASLWLLLGELELAISDMKEVVQTQTLKEIMVQYGIQNFENESPVQQFRLLMQAYRKRPKTFGHLKASK